MDAPVDYFWKVAHARAEGHFVASKGCLAIEDLQEYQHYEGLIFVPAEPDCGFCLSSGKAEKKSVKSWLSCQT